MRIQRVRIENFKCFKSADIELGKITLLTGANSSGKSSFLYSILGPLQSGEFPFQFAPNGKYVTMGNFQEMCHRQIKENKIKIGFQLLEDGNDRKKNFFGGLSRLKLKKYEIRINTWWQEENIRKLPELEKLEWISEGSERIELSISKKEKYTLHYRFDLDSSELASAKEFDFSEIDDGKLSGTMEFSNFKMSEELNNVDFLHFRKKRIDYTKETFSFLESKINFINSFRLFPDRTQYETPKTDLKVGKFGEDYINQIIFWETNEPDKYKELLEIMKSLSLLEDIRAKRFEGGRFDLAVKVNNKSVLASLSDVGFGISQFLPIIVADLQLGKGSTLLVAQPEIHLHPSVQADFGDYMVGQVKNSDKNYIIETHSEYLLNRLRLAIVKKEISPEDVKVYFLKNDGESSQFHCLEFTTDGQILNAPEDFFKTYMMDVMNIALNA
ncbi:MAG: DUF3696 domain-containing protein [Candidatus Omnitrophota bacterium]